MTTQQIIEFEAKDTFTLATVNAESLTDDQVINQFCRTLTAYAEINPGIKLCLNLIHVEFCSIAVLTALFNIQLRLKREQGSTCLTAC